MPYITQERRDELDTWDSTRSIDNAGELTYLLQQLVKEYIEQQELRYSSIAEVLGAIEGLRIDFEHRVVIPYEQKKCHDNGDVW